MNENIHEIKERIDYKRIGPKGLSEELVEFISRELDEPEWLKEFRLNAFENFKKQPFPKIPYKLADFDINKLTYYVKPFDKLFESWEDVPIQIKRIWKALGISEKEIEYFAGLATIYDSHPVFFKVKEYLRKQGVIFENLIQAAKKYPNLVKKYLGKIVPNENKLISLNSSVFTTGTFIYVPKNVKIKFPLHTIFRMTYPEFGQFERTLLIAEEGSEVTFVEGCISPMYSKWNLHVGVVEVIAKENSRVKLITLQNWSKNVINFVFTRIHAYTESFVQITEAHIGSKLVIKYPSVYLKGPRTRVEILEALYSGRDQIKDMGAKVFHEAEETKSKVISKSISKDGGINVYRGLIKIANNAKKSEAYVSCDSLILDEKSIARTYPRNEIENMDSFVSHEAKVGKLDDEKINYLISRGIENSKVMSLLTLGFLEPALKNIPPEYMIEFKKLIEFEFEGG